MSAKGPDQRNQSSSRKDRLFCSHYNIWGHSLERCFKANLNLPVCSHCRIPGYTKEKCYKLSGFPPGHHSNSKFKSSTNQSSLEQEHVGDGLPITQEQVSQLPALLTPLHLHLQSLQQITSLPIHRPLRFLLCLV